jgi:hypothetical protein
MCSQTLICGLSAALCKACLASASRIVNHRNMRLSHLLSFVGLCVVSAAACGGDVDPIPTNEEDAGRVRRDAGGSDATVTVPRDASSDVTAPKDGGPPRDSGSDASSCADPEDLGGLDSPKSLPPITDKDVTPPHRAEGILSSGTDVDSFSFFGEDVTFGLVDFRATINVPNVELCVFIKCNTGTMNGAVTCDSGTPNTDTVAGDGCCDPLTVKPKYECSGVNDSGKFELHVKAKVPMCAAYAIDYNL